MEGCLSKCSGLSINCRVFQVSSVCASEDVCQFQMNMRAQVSLLVSAGTYMMVLGLQVPLCAIMGANIGWCFGYAVGCAETATAMRAIAANIARPVLGFVQALANLGLRRLHGDPTRRRLR